MPGSLSKSEVKSLGCPYYYRAYYTKKTRQHVMPWTRIGTEFHQFMDTYVSHLVDSNQTADRYWVDYALKLSTMCEEARLLVMRYTEEFALRDPKAVIGAEAFWVIDANGAPLSAVYPGVGKAPRVDGAWAHGTIDRVERTGPDAIEITDYKTGFMPGRVSPYEALHYAVLAFCHYPEVNTVTFTWDFVRFGTKDARTFTRGDFPEMMREIAIQVAKRDQLAADTGKPECNAMAGLCGYCSVRCPLRAAAMKDTIFRPVQSEADAKKAAAIIASIRSAQSTLESQLKQYLADAGPVQLGEGQTARMQTSHSPQLELRTVMALMGVDLPETSPKFDVPLSSLRINSTEFSRYTKAKARADLKELVMASVPTKARTSLKIGDEEADV